MSKSWLPKFGELSPAQLRACNLPLEGCYLIRGPAGAGKTVVALYRAYVRKAKSPSSSLNIFVYTRALRKFIGDGLVTLEFPQDTVATFHSWLLRLYRRETGNSPPESGDSIDWDEALAELLQRLKRYNYNKIKWDMVIVDEGQDLPPDTYRLLKYFSNNITVTADDAQAIYKKSSNLGEVREALDLVQDSVRILKNYRNPRRVARLAAPLLGTSEERSQFIESAHGHRTEEQPVLYLAEDLKQEIDWLCRSVEDRRKEGRAAVVVATNNKQLKSLEKEFAERNVSVERVDRENVQSVNFNDLKPKLITMFSVKGLEFDDVFIPNMIKGVFGDWVRFPQKLLFVAITRAKRNVYLSCVKNKMEPLIDLLDKSVLHVVDTSESIDDDTELEIPDLDDLPF